MTIADVQTLYETIKQIRARHERATPGPWGPIKKNVHGKHQMVGDQDLGIAFGGSRCVAVAGTAANAKFIEHSWQDVKRLLAIVEELVAHGGTNV